MEFKDNLRILRTKADLSQAELAEKIGINQKTISSWEIGRTEPSINEVIMLCKIFHCPIEDLTGTKVRKTGDITLDDIYVKLGSLSELELLQLEETIQEKIKLKRELERVIREKRELEERIMDMEKMIKDMRKKQD